MNHKEGVIRDLFGDLGHHTSDIINIRPWYTEQSLSEFHSTVEFSKLLGDQK